ncbi:MAG: CpsD/CapB family tyrosine-protein kinase [Pseudomonadota bacterium]
MEKLQAALEKARERRGDAPVSSGIVESDAAAPSTPRERGVSSLDQRWAALEEFQTDPSHLIKNRVFSAGSKQSEAASFDVLRTKALKQMEKNGWKRLAVTSANSGAGKSTVCCNLASSIARQRSIRAILMDLDMRRPALADILGVKPTGTVADVLNGSLPFEQHARRLGPNVALSLNAHRVKDPSDVFLNTSTTETVNRIEAEYKPSIMLFDVPPMFVNDDAAAFFTNVDCVLIVADAERSRVADLDRCEKEVADHTNVLGMVLNKCRHSDEGYGYGYNSSETY